MVRKMLFVVVVALIIPHHLVFGQTSSSIDQLDALSDKALELTKLKRYEDSENTLAYFSDVFMQITAEESIFDMNEMRVITVAHHEALLAIQDETMIERDKINAVTKFRLVIDAVKSTHQPLWTNMESSMMETFSQTKEAAMQQDGEKLQKELAILRDQYDLIYPSLKVDVSAETIQQIDTRVQFIGQAGTALMTDEKAQQELVVLQQELQSIFEKMEEDEADPSLWWVMIMTGSIIVSTLSYVGWKKYIGSKTEIKERKQRDD